MGSMRMGGMKILELTVSQIEQLLPLIESYWRHDTIVGYEPSRLRRQLTEFLSEAAYGCGWLATHGDIAVGYLLVQFRLQLRAWRPDGGDR